MASASSKISTGITLTSDFFLKNFYKYNRNVIKSSARNNYNKTELAALDADKIWVIRNLGKTGINEIAGALRDLGIGHTDWDRFPL